jgi:hypothetical protein
MMWPDAVKAVEILERADKELNALHDWDCGRAHDQEMRIFDALLEGLKKKVAYDKRRSPK